MKKYALTLDLKDDPALIREYIALHENVWPEIKSSFSHSGIHDMIIYRFHTRLFMLIYTADDFSFEKKARLDRSNPSVQEWEALMGGYQQSIQGGDPNEKWQLMEEIFNLKDSEEI